MSDRDRAEASSALARRSRRFPSGQRADDAILSARLFAAVFQFREGDARAMPTQYVRFTGAADLRMRLVCATLSGRALRCAPASAPVSPPPPPWRPPRVRAAPSPSLPARQTLTFPPRPRPPSVRAYPQSGRHPRQRPEPRPARLRGVRASSAGQADERHGCRDQRVRHRAQVQARHRHRRPTHLSRLRREPRHRILPRDGPLRLSLRQEGCGCHPHRRHERRG